MDQIQGRAGRRRAPCGHEKRPDGIARFAFARTKYGRELQLDAGRIEAWRGFVKDSRPHRLDFAEILLIERGAGALWIDDRRMTVRPPVLLLTAAGQVRRFELRRPLEGFVLLFTPELAHDVARGFGRRLVWLDGHLGTDASSARTARTLARVRRVLREMVEEIARLEPGSPDLLRAQLGHALALIDRIHQHVDMRKDPHAGLAGRLRELVEVHFRSQHRVQEYARLLAVSPGHLSARVRAETGASALELIQQRLVLEAKRLLLHSGRGAAEIAYELGFDDPSYFARLFRRRTGWSPSAWRRSAASVTSGADRAGPRPGASARPAAGVPRH